MNTLSQLLLYSVLANVIVWGAFGLVVGLISYLLSPRSSGGFLLNIATGILGSLIGGFLASVFFGNNIQGIDLQSLIVAFSGALIMIIMQKALVNGASR